MTSGAASSPRVTARACFSSCPRASTFRSATWKAEWATIVDSDADADADSDADSDTDTDSDSDSDSDSDADADADTDTDSDTSSGDCVAGAKTGPALRWADPTDTVTVEDSDLLDFGVKWTVEVWVWFDGAPGVLVTKAETVGEDKTFDINAETKAHVSLAGSDQSLSSEGQTVPTGRWQHLAFVSDAANVTIFQDGEATSQTPWEKDPLDGAGQLTFGGILPTVDTGFGGYLQDLRISNVARYSRSFVPSAYLPTDINTVGLWPLSDGDPTTAEDISGNTLTGSISGPTWGDLPCRPW